MGQDLSVEEAV
uniref:Uncharacterized protein n=1 Tax=Lepeophtheirus salmonis TaxID=72036 RepID=A0A0K2TER3_LEPSM